MPSKPKSPHNPLPGLLMGHIKDNPGIMTRELVLLIPENYSTISMALYRLNQSGKIHHVNPKHDRRAQWQIGPDPSGEPRHMEKPGAGLPKQETVTTWAPPAVAPQSWCSIVLNGSCPEVK